MKRVLLTPFHWLGALIVVATRYLLVAVVIVFGIGCAEAIPQLADARVALNEAADGMNVIGAGLSAMCSRTPPPDECREVIPAFNQVAKAHSKAQDAVDVADAVLR